MSVNQIVETPDAGMMLRLPNPGTLGDILTVVNTGREYGWIGVTGKENLVSNDDKKIMNKLDQLVWMLASKEERIFMAILHKNPHDTDCMGQYADWLEEQMRIPEAQAMRDKVVFSKPRMADVSHYGSDGPEYVEVPYSKWGERG